MSKIFAILRILVIISSITGLDAVRISAEELKREEGLSVHVISKRVAELDKTNKVKWGFMVSLSNNLKPPLERRVFNKPEEPIQYFKTLPEEVQQNGIWMVTTHPDAYSEEENVSMQNLKEMCIREGVPLFIC